MKPIHYLFFAIVLFAFGFRSLSSIQNITVHNKALQHNRKSINVYGNVKSIAETDYKQFVPDSMLTNYIKEEFFTFDTTGNILYEKTNLVDWAPHEKKMKYDAHGNIIEVWKRDEKSNEFMLIYAYKLDSFGNIIEEKEMPYLMNRYDTYKCKYDARNYMIEKITTINGREQFYKYINTTDDKGNLTQQVEQIRQQNGEYKDLHIYKYTYTNNMPTKKVMYWPAINSINIDSVKYDAKNRVCLMFTDDEDGNSSQVEYKYDERNNVIEEIRSDKGKVNLRNSFKYVYEYDTFNNWIAKETLTLDGKPIKSKRREIVYY